jgi:preprotein translocase subunit SecY
MPDSLYSPRNVRRAAVVVGCLAAWCLLTSLAVPGLAPDAVARQLRDYPLWPISVAYAGVGPVIDVMVVLYLLRMLSPQGRHAVGDWGSLRHQAVLAVGVLVLAAFDSRELVADLGANGQLGQYAAAPFLVGFGVVAGTALTLALGWFVSTYAFESTVESGWLFFYAAGVINRSAYRWAAAWQRVKPSRILDAWPFIVEALIVVVVVALLVLLLRARRTIPLRIPASSSRRGRGARDDVLPLRLLWASPLFCAVLPASLASGAQAVLEAAHGPALADPALSGLLFLLGVGFVAALQRGHIDPSTLAHELQRYGAQIAGLRPGAATAAYLRTRTHLLTAVSAPWFAILLAAPQLVEMSLPAPARVHLYGVSIVLVGAILLGIQGALGERIRS